MNRRTACTLVLALSASARDIGAQVTGRMSRIGFLAEPPPDDFMRREVLEPFRQGLRDLGHVEGRNIVIEYRWAQGKFERLRELAEELVRLDLDVLVAVFPSSALVVKDVTRTVPVVAAAVDDPVQMGLAATMARPGGNITGISAFAHEMVARRLQLLRELVPGARRIGILLNPNAGRPGGLESGIAQWERTLGARITRYRASGPDEFEGAFAAMARDGIEALLVLADTNSYVHRVRLNELCLQRRLPSVWGGRDFLTGGGLASYQSDYPTMFRRTAALVDKILKGQKPAEIPFEQSTKLQLVIDKRAARAFGISVPQALLLAADEIIE